MALAALLVGAAMTGLAFAHGIAGKRFFPATLATDDPFVADELSLPLISQRRLAASGDSSATLQRSTSIDYTKRITSNLGIGFGLNYLRLQNEDGTTQKGFDNVSASVKYQFYKSDAREAIASIGVDWDIGGSGARSVGAESFSTFTPAVFFGKGMGDMPEGLSYLRPLAITGLAGVAVPSRKRSTTLDDEGNVRVEQHPDVLKAGFAVEYSLPYLQSFVKDVGLPAPINRMIPVVEFALQKPIDRGAQGFTGTVNPGLIWAGRYVQFGVEAILPVNHRTGGGKGLMLQLHFFIDDIFPRSFGRPLL